MRAPPLMVIGDAESPASGDEVTAAGEAVSVSQHPQDTPTIEERQLRALLNGVDPARAALVDLDLDDDTLDALALERAVQALRREAASRDGRSAGWLLMEFAELLESRLAL